MDCELEINRFQEIIKKEITKTRLEHSYRVAELSERYAKAHGYIFPRKAYFAGLVHDIAKQKNKEFLMKLFESNKFNFKAFPEPSHHAFAGAFYLKESFQLEDEEILSAVSNHTLGGVHLNLLDNILYFSDFLGSDYAIKQNDYEEWLKKSGENLYYGIYIKSKNVIQDLLDNKLPIHKYTFETYNQAIIELNRGI